MILRSFAIFSPNIFLITQNQAKMHSLTNLIKVPTHRITMLPENLELVPNFLRATPREYMADVSILSDNLQGTLLSSSTDKNRNVFLDWGRRVIDILNARAHPAFPIIVLVFPVPAPATTRLFFSSTTMVVL